MLTFIKRNHRILFYSAWCLLNLIQAGFTELFDDEAYYWVYAQFPDWGYFDHPPFIALLIKAGYAIFPNELGVRFFIVLLNTATIFITQQLIAKKDDFLFYAIAASMAIIQIGGFMAVPDLPLLFFVALFFWLYRRFAATMNLWNTTLLGLCVAFMLYSKYHGILIVVFTLVSNVKLFRHYQTYLVTAIALLAFAPHLYWQYQQGFPSIQFHLFERSASHYDTRYTIEYLAGQLALAGPLMGWLLLKGAAIYKPQDALERALKYTLAGFYGFFLLTTFRGRVEANWTVPAFIGLIVLSHQYLLREAAVRSWLYKSLPFSIGFVLLVRIYMLPAIPHTSWVPKDEFHENKTWVREVQQKARGLPVVFTGSYQKASKFWFYSKTPSMSMNAIDYRRNNYNFWPVEDSLIGEQVMVVGGYDSVYRRHKITTLPGCGFGVYAPYYSFSKINIRYEGKLSDSGNCLLVNGSIHTPANYLPFLRQYPYDSASLLLAFEDDDERIHFVSTGMRAQQISQAVQHFDLKVPLRLPPGKYTCRFAFNSCIAGTPSMNSTGMKVLLQ